MKVRRFNAKSDHAQTAAVYGRTADELRARDEASGRPVLRWTAWLEDEIVGAADAWLRPDDRLFLSFVGVPSAIGSLTDAVVSELGRPVHAMVDPADAAVSAALGEAGFVVEMTAERFRVPFEPVLALLRRARLPPGFSIESAAGADPDRLFELDNEVRRDVPGTDGWVGNRAWFQEELDESPPFDPAAYLVGIEQSSGRYAGLIRIWRNPSGPRFGLVGVARPFRRTTLAAALIRLSLEAAAGWGHAEFTTESSLANRVVHPRLQRIGVSEGIFHQLVKT